MNKTTIFQKLLNTESEVIKLLNIIFALKTTDIKKYGENYEQLSVDAALRAERIACQLRNLVHITDFTGKSTYHLQAAEALNIQITYGRGILSITLPGLLPKRKLHTNTAFLHDPLHYALKDYICSHKIEPYKECVICFQQVYNRELSLHRVRDYDNIEFKLILDIIASHVLLDDTSLYCDTYHTIDFGNTDQTVIYIMEPSVFPCWLSANKPEKNISENL